MNIKTKIVAALSLAVFIIPGLSLAQTMSVAQLQAEIVSLTAQLTQLETQLAAAGGTTATWCYAFNTNLSIGMSGADVTALQTALQKDGESVTVNGTFDDQTAAAVTGFQEKYASAILSPYGLTNGTGYAGKSTRAQLNSLFECSGTTNPTPAPVTPPIVVNPIVPASSSSIVACPMFVPYCPYGGHGVVESNGCTEEVCNAAPAPVSVTVTSPTITNLSSNQGTATSNITIYGTNLTSGGNPTIQFYSSNGALAGTIDSVAMGYISSQSIVFTPTVSNSLLSALSPGTYQIDVLTPNGTSNSESFTLLAPVVQAPVINSFSVSAGPAFSLSAYNYNTITFQAQCGNFVAVVQPQNGSPALYPTGSASICNAPQTYSSSSFNETPSIAPQMVNVPLSLYNAQGVVDGSITMIGSPAGSNNSGSASLTVNVCNSAGVCVQRTASFPIYAKG
jgi:peptidoglycan hydrolase-like protein with peptidoglycan-binding domain